MYGIILVPGVAMPFFMIAQLGKQQLYADTSP